MFQLQKSFRFEASHQLVHHDGKCRRVHGHSYLLTIVLSGDTLQKAGSGRNMLCDFQHVSNAVKPLIASHFDHHHLNDTLETDSPTAEFIAQWVYERIRPQLPLLESVMVQETASSLAVYRPLRSCCACQCHVENPVAINGDVKPIKSQPYPNLNDVIKDDINNTMPNPGEDHPTT